MAEDGRPVSAADSAYHTLRADILSGALAADERLTELGLADRLGLSRTPVREAVKRLLIEGFLTRSPGDGLRVTGLQADEVEQIFRIRLMLESYGARRAAQYASEAEIARLFRLANEISARTPPKSEDDYDAITHANAEFHRTIVQAARSQRLGSMLSLAVNMGLVVRTYRMYSEHDMVRQAGHHHDIAEAIAARDPEWAEAAMSNHVIAAAATTRASKAEAFLGNPARTPGRNAPAPRKQV